jgi:hypothetical protein
MPYPHYNGPTKANKGLKDGACNRSRCQDEPAEWYNHGAYAWYCERCRWDIEFDSFNLRDWQAKWQTKCGHPMFETADQMVTRKDPWCQQVRKLYTQNAIDSRFYLTVDENTDICAGHFQTSRMDIAMAFADLHRQRAIISDGTDPFLYQHLEPEKYVNSS